VLKNNYLKLSLVNHYVLFYFVEQVYNYINYRKKSGNPGYMVLFNLGAEDRQANTTAFPDIPETLSLLLSSADPQSETK
jgi:hypothetical protein